MTEELWFLTDRVHEVPEPTDFPVTGFIGELSVAHTFRVWGDIAPNIMKEEGIKYDLCQPMGSGYVYFFTNYDAGVVAQEYFVSRVNPRPILYVAMPTDTVLNFRDETALAKWGATVWGEIPNNTLKSNKYRHESHLIFLPRLVAAVADAQGIKNAGFSLAEIDMQRDDFVASDELHDKLIGPAVKEGYIGSLFWERRAELWASLGEDNPEKCAPIGATITRAGQTQPSELATTAKPLSDCLEAYVADWDPVYARLKLLPDPHVDALTGADKRLTIPVVWELFKDKTAAEAARDADLEAMGIVGEPVGDAPTPPTSGVPAKWAEIPEGWFSTIAGLKASGEAATPALAKTLEVTLPELMAALK